MGPIKPNTEPFSTVKEQLSRTPRKLPKLVIKRKVDSVVDFRYEDFEVVDYDPYPAIKGVVSV